MERRSKDFEYALYKGDKFIEIGPLHELAKIQGVSVKTLRWYSTPAYMERAKEGKDRTYVVPLGEPL